MELIALLMIGHAVTMIRFARAYHMIAVDLKKILISLPQGRPREHLFGAAGFIKWCAGSHVVAFLELLIMAALMWKVSHEGIPHVVLDIIAGFYVISLIPLVLGGEYSHYRATRLREDSDELRQFVTQLWGESPQKTG